MKQEDTYVNARSGNYRTSNPYSRHFGMDIGEGAGTYVPGMHENAPGVNEESFHAANETPVVGFLYSISRKGIGEYWPLHLGTNSIGRAEDCDIRLNESSVSEHHAVISVKQMKTANKLIASIRDVGSKNGIFLNDEELDYENHSCKMHDLITIGHNYKLLLLLIDAEHYGLTVAENFVPAIEESELMPGKMNGFFNPYSGEDRPKYEGTVDLSGDKFDDPGGTNIM